VYFRARIAAGLPPGDTCIPPAERFPEVELIASGYGGPPMLLAGSEHLLANRLTIAVSAVISSGPEVWSGYPDPSSVLCWWL
jgi:hypothetical protein